MPKTVGCSTNCVATKRLCASVPTRVRNHEEEEHKCSTESFPQWEWDQQYVTEPRISAKQLPIAFSHSFFSHLAICISECSFPHILPSKLISFYLFKAIPTEGMKQEEPKKEKRKEKKRE
jgi:hypothetical protein